MQRSGIAVFAKMGAKTAQTRNLEYVTILWITLGMAEISTYCKSLFLDIRRRKSTI
jgi:hypothetical protein